MRALTLMLLLVLLLTSITAVTAQTTPLCPPQALLSIARAGAACANLEAGNACYGSGLVTSGEPPELAQLGDRVPLRDLRVIHAVPSGTDEISIAVLAIRTSPRATDVLTMLLIGDAEVATQVTPPVEQVMQATGTLNLRAAPAQDAPVLATLGINNRVVANGRYEDWLRVLVPATGETAWVGAALLSGDTSRLPAVQPVHVAVQPFSSVIPYAPPAGVTYCDGALHSGILMQTPSTDLKDAVILNLPPSVLRLAGTAFLTATEERYVLIVLDGAAVLDDRIIPAGASSPDSDEDRLSIAPYDPVLVAALPVNNLPRRFQVVPPQPQDVIDAHIAALNAPPPTAVPTIEPTPTNACRRTVGRNSDLMSGPGVDYEALGEISAGTPIRPQLAFTDPRGGVWWQLPDSGWVARADVVERGDCSAQVVPVTDRITAPPTNTYSMERCQSSNGPVRVGQTVTFEFVPPAWDNLNAAYTALRTDPGHFEINAQRYNARASDPIRLQENVARTEARYLRRFTYVWHAEPGTFRITGDWLHYEPSCNLTVTVE